jgi:hypothetical protein
MWYILTPRVMNMSLQEIRSIATIIIAMTCFCCNRMQYYHEILVCGNSLRILLQCSFVAVITFFVAIEDVYCNKTQGRCNMVRLLRQLHFVA